MKIKVIEKNKDNPRKVLCESKYGQFHAFWSEDDVIENKWYYIELDSDEELMDEINLFGVDEESCICNEGEQIKIVGLLESMDSDGYMIVRVGTSALTFMAYNSVFKPGLVIKILLNHIKAYPIEY